MAESNRRMLPINWVRFEAEGRPIIKKTPLAAITDAANTFSENFSLRKKFAARSVSIGIDAARSAAFIAGASFKPKKKKAMLKVTPERPA